MTKYRIVQIDFELFSIEILTSSFLWETWESLGPNYSTVESAKRGLIRLIQSEKYPKVIANYNSNSEIKVTRWNTLFSFFISLSIHRILKHSSNIYKTVLTQSNAFVIIKKRQDDIITLEIANIMIALS